MSETMYSSYLIFCYIHANMYLALLRKLSNEFAYSFVSQGLQGQPLNAVTTAAGFALFQGIIFQGELSFFTCIYIMNQVHKHFFLPPFLTKLGERFSKPSPEDPFYTRSRTMLLKLARSREVREELQENTFNRSYVAFAH